MVKYTCDIIKYSFECEVYFFGRSVVFRVTKNLHVRKISNLIVSQQSEKGIFTSVVSFCETTLYFFTEVFMKTLKKFFAMLFACIVLLLSLSSCGILNSIFPKDTCQHEWSNYIAKAPTCTENGIMEKNCNLCGLKQYEEIFSSGHSYKNSVCSVCGKNKTDADDEPTFQKISIPANSNNDAKWTFEDIFNHINPFYEDDSAAYEYFLNELTTGYIQDAYVDSLNLLHLTAIEKNDETPIEISLALAIERVTPTNPATAKFQNIYRVEVQNEQLTITYADGLQISVGKIKTSIQETVIQAFGINRDNELIVYYSDNTMAFVGQIPHGAPTENQSLFLYSQVDNGYSLVSANNISETNLEIPLTHRGKPIVRIQSQAFNQLDNLKSIKIGENVNYIETDVFNISSLEYVIFPDSPITIENVDGYLENTNVKFFFAGARSEYTFIGEQPQGNFFFKGDWTYVDGVPRGFVS